MKKIFFAVLLGISATAVLSTSCVKDDFAEPAPYSDTTSIEKNTTISQLKGMWGNGVLAVPDSVIIEGVVISDDKAGNFYKSIYIQDATGGIEIKLSKTTLYNDYKRGQRLIVVCKGLFIGDYGGMRQLGSTYSPDGIVQIGGLETDYIIGQHIIKKGKKPNPVDILEITTPSVLNAGKLVKIKDAEFLKTVSDFDGSRLTYAISTGSLVRSRILKLKSGVPVELRTSDFSAFAGDVLPTGSGSIVGILSVYNGAFQLVIRDTKDVVMDDPRF
ncbi:DUF5689 domain-containing protein [Williamwhitmania taraxaci]|uniref:DUF5689 domain-containing protein n=1 Tax=Williamwhitmania taraxaci TaxID=1640674 RepID=A0A1G6RW30_9BACT|nr:DUF5689 domain-containing protein [Williamwhitmania taraxaci]SDD08641.1 hypothetical protein SAMN05216323_10823 [Williamwhitmania taraxaci]